MKLYTEEQVIQAIDLARLQGTESFLVKYRDDEILMILTPIELPSDEEIEKNARDENIYNNLQFRLGAKYVIDKIKGDTNDK